MMSESTETAISWRVILLFILTLVCNLVLVIFALTESRAPDELILQVMTFILPVVTFVVTLLLYTFCVIERAYIMIFALLIVLAFSLLIVITLVFTFPENNRLNALSTLFALNLAFVGFLASMSGVGIRRIQFKRNNGRLELGFVIESDEDEAS